MAKKQVFGLKAQRGLCPVCGEKIQHIQFIKPISNGQNSYKFNDFVAKICKCEGKLLKNYAD